MIEGQRVDEPQLRPMAEYFVHWCDRMYNLVRIVQPIWVVIAVSAVVGVLLRLNELESPWSTASSVLFAVVAIAEAIFGRRLFRTLSRRLDINRPGRVAERQT